jgi:hypothetical protein
MYVYQGLEHRHGALEMATHMLDWLYLVVKCTRLGCTVGGKIYWRWISLVSSIRLATRVCRLDIRRQATASHKNRVDVACPSFPPYPLLILHVPAKILIWIIVFQKVDTNILPLKDWISNLLVVSASYRFKLWLGRTATHLTSLPKERHV